MKNMAVLIDTNVIIDYLTQRDPFMQEADAILEKCFTGEVHGYVAAHTITNIFYILRKQYSIARRKEMLSELCVYVGVTGVDKEKIISAIKNEQFNDIEDSLQVECALSINADYIVTRNTDDFTNSPIPAIVPEAFLGKL